MLPLIYFRFSAKKVCLNFLVVNMISFGLNTMCLAMLKARLAGTDVAGIAKYFFARLER